MCVCKCECRSVSVQRIFRKNPSQCFREKKRTPWSVVFLFGFFPSNQSHVHISIGVPLEVFSVCCLFISTLHGSRHAHGSLHQGAWRSVSEPSGCIASSDRGRGRSRAHGAAGEGPVRSGALRTGKAPKPNRLSGRSVRSGRLKTKSRSVNPRCLGSLCDSLVHLWCPHIGAAGGPDLALAKGLYTSK